MTFEDITTFEQGKDTEAEILLSRLYHTGVEHRAPAVQQAAGAADRRWRRWKNSPSAGGTRFTSRTISLTTRIALLNGYHRAHRLVNCTTARSPYTKSKALARCSFRECPFCTYIKGQDILQNCNAPARSRVSGVSLRC